MVYPAGGSANDLQVHNLVLAQYSMTRVGGYYTYTKWTSSMAWTIQGKTKAWTMPLLLQRLAKPIERFCTWQIGRFWVLLRIGDSESLYVFSEFRVARVFSLRIPLRMARFRHVQSKACGSSIRILTRSATCQLISIHSLGFNFMDWFAPVFLEFRAVFFRNLPRAEPLHNLK